MTQAITLGTKGLTNSSNQARQAPSRWFPGLNQLRFFAATAVLVHHIEQTKFVMGYASLWAVSSPVVFLGIEGVRLFFVLSGFLITVLLLKERSEQKRVDIYSFYQRRALRIWPLYYLTVLFALFIFPSFIHLPESSTADFKSWPAALNDHFWSKVLLTLVFLPNYCRVRFKPIIGVAHCWSLGVEEQFYLVWPLLLMLFRGRAFYVGIFTAIALKYGAILFTENLATQAVSHHVAQNLTWLADTIRTIDVESFAAGGFAAFLFLSRSEAVQKLASNKLAILAGCLAITVACISDFWLSQTLGTLGFVWAILFMTSNAIGGKLGSSLDYFGRISYGIYMLHPFILLLLTQSLISRTTAGTPDWLITAIIYIVTFGLTIVASIMSYECFESPFLRFKKRIVKIDQGP